LKNVVMSIIRIARRKHCSAGERGGSAGGGSGSRLLRRGLIIIIETIRTLRGAAEPLMVE
jgi:hypothetical protein